MPWEKGSHWGLGNYGKMGEKGWEKEKAQLITIRERLDRQLELLQKIQDGQATEDEKKNYFLTYPFMSKLSDKVIASREIMETYNQTLEAKMIKLSPESERLLMEIIKIENSKEDPELIKIQNEKKETKELSEAVSQS